MQRSGAAVVFFAALFAAGCSKPPDLKWSTGFWFWQGSSASVLAPRQPVDVIYFQAGAIRTDPVLSARQFGHERLPQNLPLAREYWAVYRYDGTGVPPSAGVEVLARNFAELQRDARELGLHLSGIQLDVDSPTNRLPDYAVYLVAVRKAIPIDAQLSITCLLDWFRSGTAIRDVLRNVDEFVPQFYDVQNADGYPRSATIAAPFDAAKWGPVFNLFKKRFRIGLSTFGRSRFITNSSSGGRPLQDMQMGDAKPLDFAMNPAFSLEASTTDSKELVLKYRANNPAKVGYTNVDGGDTFQFVLSTPESIRSAAEQVKRIHGYCAGLLFFRWPSFNEALAMNPEEVLAAMGEKRANSPPGPTLREVNGGCAAVSCVDLYWVGGNAIARETRRFTIQSSTALEYFLPAEAAPVRMSGTGLIELALPPYCGATRMYLGRAVTLKSSAFTLVEK